MIGVLIIKIKEMDNLQFERKVYKAPISNVFHVEDLELILHSSFEGQHNPGHHGSGPSSAKSRANLFCLRKRWWRRSKNSDIVKL